LNKDRPIFRSEKVQIVRTDHFVFPWRWTVARNAAMAGVRLLMPSRFRLMRQRHAHIYARSAHPALAWFGNFAAAISGFSGMIRCARPKPARAITSYFLRHSGMHQAPLFIAMVSLLNAFSFSASAATLPSGFVETIVASGIASPTAMAIAPDGRIFVCSQTGALRVIKNGVLLATPFVTLSVDSTGERGLLGIAFDPGFNLNRFIYLYYTVPGTPAHNRVIRVTANGDVVLPGSDVVILELNSLSTALVHNGGALHFGPDRNLYIAVGDNAKGTNAQNLSILFGKILRLNSDGTIPPDNPFAQSTTARREIWALGLRNPFTFAFRGTTSFMYINDVGLSTWEEINLGQAGANYGWPATEGPTTNPAYKSPSYYYGHSDGCAITGGAFYSPTTPNFPSFYVGKYFFGDYCSGFIRVLDPATAQATDFITGASEPVDIQVGADGSLYYLARGTDSVMQVRYTTNVSPVITAQPASKMVSVGYPATFSATASGSSPLSYQWMRNGVDISGATARKYTIASTSLLDNGAQFRLRVSNPSGSTLSNVATLSVTSNEPPVGQILTPAQGKTYFGGMVVKYSGSASDFEDGDLPASAFTWQVDFHHDTHFHPFIAATTGSKTGTFTIPTRGEVSANVYYRIMLKVRDSMGLTQTVTRDILPRKVDMTFATLPAGLQIALDGQNRVTPFTVTGVVGIIRAIAAPSPQTANGLSYVFQSWSDGGAKSHEISTPAVNSTYTANFTRP
jgi:glucose/arabinose dehydrogenase